MALTIKREKFCIAYVETGNASEAYRRAFNTSKMKAESVHSKASLLLSDIEVRARVEELKAAHAKRHEVTVDDIRRMLLEDRDFAREVSSAAASVSATTALAKLYGHMRDKVEHTGKDGGPIKSEVRDTSIDDLIEEARRLGIDPAAMGLNG